MTIGIPKETKPYEYRVALTPEYAGRLVRNGHVILLEKGTGTKVGFSDETYKGMGVRIVPTQDVYKAQMIVRVKRPQINTLRTNQIIMGYLHVEKGENPPLLKALLKKNITAFAYHLFRDKRGKRLINLGYEAGVVGIYEGLRVYGRIQRRIGNKSAFANLPSSWDCGSEEGVVGAVKNIADSSLEKPRIYLMGNGLVAKGCSRVLNQINIPYFILHREDTKYIERYLPLTDILVNATYWLPGEPRIITKKLLTRMKKTTPIIDVSCEEGGAVETTVERSWANPSYEVNGITHFTVGNLPSAIGQDASKHLSDMIFPFVQEIAKGNHHFTGLITKQGNYMYQLPNQNLW